MCHYHLEKRRSPSQWKSVAQVYWRGDTVLRLEVNLNFPGFCSAFQMTMKKPIWYHDELAKGSERAAQRMSRDELGVSALLDAVITWALRNDLTLRLPTRVSSSARLYHSPSGDHGDVGDGLLLPQ